MFPNLLNPIIFSSAEPKEALCGNGVVEEGEECDCGWEEDCEEECCWPQTSKPRPGQTPCTLRPNKVCSPTQVRKNFKAMFTVSYSDGKV